MSSNLSEFQNSTVGMMAGVIEVLMLQPLNYAKNMIQQKQPVSLNPTIMYRGVLANCVNMGSCTMVQFAVGGKLQKLVAGKDTPNRKLSPLELMGCGLGAGMVSALVGSPLELIMIQQQRKGGSTIETIKNIVSPQIQNVGRGFFGSAIREGFWTVGYLSIPPIIRTYLREQYPQTFDSNEKARVPAALLGGFFACYLTHPADTIKTCMQGDIERKTYDTFTKTAAKIYAENNVLGFYRGATFRYGRLACGAFILDTLKELVGPLLYPDAYKK